MAIQVNETVQRIIFVVLVIACLTPYVDPPLALLLGFILAQTSGHPFLKWNSKGINWLLKSSVVGLGFGMNLHHAIEAGKEGIVFTVSSIVLTLVAGWLLGKWLKTDDKTSALISGGTAICGGSAIAALSPIIKADEKQVSVALGTIFILNSIALLIFPTIGHWLNMTQGQFGLWCAIAIHDTSSVVGAASKYGQEALQIAATVKLERALWIIPLSLLAAFFMKGSGAKINIPYFIGLFVLAIIVSSFLPDFKEVYSVIVIIAKKGLTVTLFLIGAGLSFKNIKAVGPRPLLQGVILWILISVISNVAIMMMVK